MLDNKARINDDALDEVSGGAIFCSKGIMGADPNNPWEVLDDRGNVVGRFNNRNDAVNCARDKNLGTWEANWDMVQSMRSN